MSQLIVSQLIVSQLIVSQLIMSQLIVWSLETKTPERDHLAGEIGFVADDLRFGILSSSSGQT